MPVTSHTARLDTGLVASDYPDGIHTRKSWRHCQAALTPIYSHGVPLKTADQTYMVGFGLDIHKQKAEQQRLAALAKTDALTGLMNRGQFENQGRKSFLQCARYDQTLSLILLDIDHFKQVNDQYGHEVGDQVLRQIASIMRSCIREVDSLYRYGGEEFAILLPRTDCAGAAVQAERLRLAVEQTHFANDLQISVSLGVADYRPQDDLHKLVRRADSALYQAKNFGRNRVEIGE